MKQMELRPQDVVVALKLVARFGERSTYAGLASELALSPSQVFMAVERGRVARLLDAQDQPKPNRANLKEFLIHGVKYAFPAERGGISRGVPTAYAAPPLNQLIVQAGDAPPVWPDPEGAVRGLEFSPLYHNVPRAARRDPKLYELLALVDAIREGRGREREIAIRELTSRIDSA
jgi:hypothetical protein